MAKTPSTRLYELVHSLNGAEKRYFKVQAQSGRHGESKYLQLFDAIVEQDCFDEEALKRSVYGDAVPESRKYSELKGYLYDLILHSLQAFDEKKHLRNRLQQKLLQAESLFRRSRFSDCIALLDKVILQAGRFEWHSLVLSALDWKLHIAYTRADIDVLNAELDHWMDQTNHWQNLLDNHNRYQFLFLRIYTLLRQLGANHPGVRKQLNELMKEDLLRRPCTDTSFRAQLFHRRIWALYHYGTGNFRAFREVSEQLTDLLESRPEWLGQDPSIYISALNNLAISYGLDRQYEAVERCLEKLDAVRPKTLDDELKIHRQYYANAFRLHIMRGEFDLGYELLKTHLSASQKYDQHLFERSSFLFQYFYLAFGSNHHGDALDYLNQWLNLPKTLERQDLQLLARILNLILHYELGHDILLENLLRATRRYLGRKNPLKGLDEQFTRLFQILRTKKPASEQKAAFSHMLDQLDGLKSQPSLSNIFHMFNLRAWIISKRDGLPFAEVVRREFESKHAIPENGS